MQNESENNKSSTGIIDQEEDPFDRQGLSRISIEHKPIFDLYFSSDRTCISDRTFASVFMWSQVYDVRWKIVRDCLCIFATQGGDPTMIFPPIGWGDFELALQECLFFFKEFNPQRLYVEYATEEAIEKLGIFETVPRSGDYIYETQKMIELKGSDLASKRQSRNAFIKKYSNIYTEKFSAKHTKDCLNLLDIWQPQVQGSISIDLKRSQEVNATKRVIQNAEALGLTGMVLYADDQIVGFTFGEKLGTDSCSIIIEKTDRRFTGSAQYIFSEFCRQYWADTQWCNAGDDWEIPGLAWTKESYHPAFRIPKWSACFSYEKSWAVNYACS